MAKDSERNRQCVYIIPYRHQLLDGIISITKFLSWIKHGESEVMLSEKERTVGVVQTVERESILEIQPPKRTRRSKKAAVTTEADVDESKKCDFCGRSFEELETVGSGKDRRKYCSEACRRRAGQGRKTVRLAMPVSKRYAARLRFSNPLYFN